MKVTTRYNGKSGLYVCAVPVKGMRSVISALDPHFPEEAQLDSDLHCTLMYSRETAPHPLTVSKVLSQGEGQFSAIADSVKFWPGHDNKGYLVVALHSDDLRARHEQWKTTGATHSFPDYEPHVTLASGFGEIDKATLRIMNLILRRGDYRLTFGGERAEDIKG